MSGEAPTSCSGLTFGHACSVLWVVIKMALRHMANNTVHYLVSRHPGPPARKCQSPQWLRHPHPADGRPCANLIGFQRLPPDLYEAWNHEAGHALAADRVIIQTPAVRQTSECSGSGAP